MEVNLSRGREKARTVHLLGSGGFCRFDFFSFFIKKDEQNLVDVDNIRV